ncbi:MAG: hypothetical protein V3T22_03555 [Planctomycetota bacterium]
MGLDAFEEFDEIEISGAQTRPQPAEGQPAEGQAAGPPAVDALDEDLFDFPLPDMPHSEPAIPAVSTVPVVPDPVPAPVAGAAPTPAPDPAPALPTAGPSAGPSAAVTVAVAVAVAADALAGERGLDDDLFQFPAVFSGALLATPLEDGAHVSVQSDIFVVEEQELEAPTMPVVQAAPQPHAPAQAPAQAAPVPSPVPNPHFTPEPQTPPPPPSTPVPAAAAPRPEPDAVEPQVTPSGARASEPPDFDPAAHYQGYPRYLPPSDEELARSVLPAGGRSHLTEILAVGFLVLNVALVLFAYQANASFHDTLTEVTRNIANTLTDNRASAQELPPTITFPLPPSIQVLGDPLPGETVALTLQSLTLARRMVEEERYLDARRVLYRLLANRDLALLETSFVAEAEYLIAESYELQGKALAEAQR